MIKINSKEARNIAAAVAVSLGTFSLAQFIANQMRARTQKLKQEEASKKDLKDLLKRVEEQALSASKSLERVPGLHNVSSVIKDMVPALKNVEQLNNFFSIINGKDSPDKQKLLRKLAFALVAMTTGQQGFNLLLQECPGMAMMRSSFVKSSFTPSRLEGRWYLTGYSGQTKLLQGCQVSERVVSPSGFINERVSGRAMSLFPYAFHRRYVPAYANGIFKRHADYPMLSMARVTSVVLDVIRDWYGGYDVVVEYACASALGFQFQEIRIFSRRPSIDPSMMERIRIVLQRAGLNTGFSVLDHTRCPVDRATTQAIAESNANAAGGSWLWWQHALYWFGIIVSLVATLGVGWFVGTHCTGHTNGVISNNGVAPSSDVKSD